MTMVHKRRKPDFRKKNFEAKQTIVIYGPSYKTLRRSIDRIEMNIESIESKKRKMPLLKELSRTSRDSFGLDSDSKESWDDWLNSFKSGVLYFFDSIDSIFISIRSILRPGVVVDRPGNIKHHQQQRSYHLMCESRAVAACR